MGTTPFLGFQKMSPPYKRGVNLWSVGGSHQEKAQSCRGVMTQRHVRSHTHINSILMQVWLVYYGQKVRQINSSFHKCEGKTFEREKK